MLFIRKGFHLPEAETQTFLTVFLGLNGLYVFSVLHQINAASR